MTQIGDNEFFDVIADNTTLVCWVKNGVGRQYLLSPRIWMEVYPGLGVHFRKYRIVEDPIIHPI